MTGEDSQTDDRFNAKLTTGGLGVTGVTYARTGCLGFIKRTDFTQTDGGRKEPIDEACVYETGTIVSRRYLKDCTTDFSR